MTTPITTEDIFHLGVKALVRNDNGRILLMQVNPAKLKNSPDAYWDLPGGRVQKGQTVADTLKREVAEETGVTDIEVTRDVGMVLSNIRIPIGTETVGLILSVYECRMLAGVKIELSDEHAAYDWFSPAEAAELLGLKYPPSFCSLVASLES